MSENVAKMTESGRLASQVESALQAMRENWSDLMEAAIPLERRAILEEYDRLRDCYFELLRNELHESEPAFAQAASKALKAASDTEAAVRDLAAPARVIKAAAGAVNLIGGLLVGFA